MFNNTQNLKDALSRIVVNEEKNTVMAKKPQPIN